jgi:acyl-CoA dehydrogenase
MMMQRSMERKVFGKYIWEHGSCQEMIADSVADLSAARLLTLSCAAALDDVGARQARDQIASIKVAVPAMTFRVVDRAVQVFGGAGLSEDYVLAQMLAGLRSLRIADGPDAVHQRTVARLQVKKAKRDAEMRRKTTTLSRL